MASVEAAKCGDCGTVVKEADKGIECEICLRWLHTKCEGVKDETYRCIKKDQGQQGIHWYCKVCESGVVKILKSVQILQIRIDKVEERQAKIETTVEEMRKSHENAKRLTDEKLLKYSETSKDFFIKVQSEFDKLNNEIENLKENQNKPSTDIDIDKQVEELTAAFLRDEKNWTEIVKKEVGNKFTNVSDELTQINKMVLDTKCQVDEVKDKDLRKNNVIIYRIPENSGTTYEARIKEDKDVVMKILKYLIDDDLNENEIVKVIRIGRRTDDASKPRAILVQFVSGMTKNYMMNNLYKLKKAPDDIKSIVISHDMTKLEREECKRLVQEAKEKESEDHSGEWVYRVRGLPGMMKIVKWKKH